MGLRSDLSIIPFLTAVRLSPDVDVSDHHLVAVVDGDILDGDTLLSAEIKT